MDDYTKSMKLQPMVQLEHLIKKGHKSDSLEIKACMKRIPKTSIRAANSILAMSAMNKSNYPSTEVEYKTGDSVGTSIE